MIGNLSVTCFCSITTLRYKKHHVEVDLVFRIEDTRTGRVLSHWCIVTKRPLAPLFRWSKNDNQ